MNDGPDYRYHTLLNSGELYDSGIKELTSYQHELVELLRQYNATPETSEGLAKRRSLLPTLLGSCGEHVCLMPPVHANWGLRHVHIGDDVYFNFGATFVDDADILIGSRCQFGPNVTICTAEHPLDPSERARGLQYNLPVRIEDDVWVGAGAIILAGVTIGHGAVVGAGSVVTRDVEPLTVVAGAPARVIRCL
ncbi:MAG: sugar O-acetyltransferase [Atopobiaceae bacterium]|nr:sugar O-acetyltransferase [Atopobiaceae bacterium]